MTNRLEETAWQAAHELGYPPIDDDHRNMVEVCNQLARALNGDQITEAIVLTRRFIEVSRVHFEREERLMADIGYPDIEPHAAYHGRLLTTAESLFDACESYREAEFLKEQFVVLARCLLEDVLSGDRELVPHLAAKGLVPT